MTSRGTPSRRTRIMLIFAAYRELLVMEFLLWRGGFAAIHRTVAEFPKRATMQEDEPETICRALDIACVFYFKEVLCLQRSAAAVRLLRKRGIAAELVTGVQQWPFSAHAWAEVARRVVNDKPHVTAAFAVIERC
jgi:hypothetical protein